MGKFQIGNVIRTKEGSIEIVYDVKSDGYTNTIPVDFTNAHCGYHDKTRVVKEWCHCNQIDCEYCYENKPYDKVYYGMEDATLVARTVQEWIVKTLTKGFGF